MSQSLNHRRASGRLHERGQKVTAAAEFVGLERTYMSRCFAGTRKFPMELLPRLAEFLDCDPYELLGPTDPKAAVVELARLYNLTADDLAVAS